MNYPNAISWWREEFLEEFPMDAKVLAESAAQIKDEGIDLDVEIPVRYREALLTKADHPELRAWMADLARTAIRTMRARPTVRFGDSLLLMGNTGVGKTHAIYGIIRGLGILGVSPGWKVITAADMFASLRPRAGIDSESLFQKYTKTALLIVDDLGATKPSDWTEEVTVRLFDHRYDNEAPMIVATNLAPADLASHLGARVSSRLAQMAGENRITLKGPDRRYKA